MTFKIPPHGSEHLVNLLADPERAEALKHESALSFGHPDATPIVRSGIVDERAFTR